MTKKTVLERIAGLTDEQKRAVVCALVGHSRIMTVCFGYWSCARCGAQVGDSIAGVFDGRDKVIVGHDCDTCRKAAQTLTWQDMFLAPDPFAREDVGA